MIDIIDTESLTAVKKLKHVAWFTYFCSISADLVMLSIGLQISWYSPVITKLLSKDTELNPFGEPISVFQVSIMTVTPLLASVVMFSPWAKIMNIIGSKRSMVIVVSIHLCCLIVLAFAKTITLYLILLPLTGVLTSGGVLSVVVYNTEIAQDSNRGTINCIMSMHIPIGILLGYIIGSVTSVKCFNLICAIPPIICLVSLYFLPESPYYLLSKQKDIQGFAALETLRGKEHISEIELEFKKIKFTIDNTSLGKSRSLSDFIKSSLIRKAFFLSIQLFIVEQLSGISIVLSYVSPIFSNAGSGLSGDVVGILVGLIKLISFIPAIYYVDKIGRRTLILISTFGSSTIMWLLGTFFYLDHIGSNIITNIRWCSIVFVLLYIFSYGIGLGNVPLAFAGEIFPKEARAAGIALALIVNQIIMGVVIFSFPLISTHWGLYYCFWFCASASALGFVSIYFTMPETKGKSLLEITQLLQK